PVRDGLMASKSTAILASESKPFVETYLEPAALALPVKILERVAVPRFLASLSLPHKRVRTVFSKDKPWAFSSCSKLWNRETVSSSIDVVGRASPDSSMNSPPSQEKMLFFTAFPYHEPLLRVKPESNAYQDSNLFDSTIHGFNVAMLTRLFSVF